MKKLILTFAITAIAFHTFSQAANSVLATGSWYKVGVAKDGIYKLTYSNLQALGINVGSIDPRNIRMYGNGGGMVPIPNYIPRPDDLTEIAIKVIGEGDGVFDPADYVLFYGQGQHRWQFGSDTLYHHTTNLFADTTYYFITTGAVAGKRIPTVQSSTQAATGTVSAFDDYVFHELDSVNFLKSGKDWYGEEFTISNSLRIFTFVIPSLSSGLTLNYSVAGRSFTDRCYFQFAVGSLNQTTSTFQTTNSITADYATLSAGKWLFSNSNDTVVVNINLTSNDASATGWLNFLELNYRRLLTKSATELFFRDRQSVNAGAISQFNIANTVATDVIWEITTHSNVKEIQSSYSGGQTTMRVPTDSVREFVAFNPSTSISPSLTGTVANQNLHGMPQAQLIIISNPQFLSAANALATLHRSFDGLSVNIATTSQIYNEFSSGAQDISAMRDFVRMFYKRAAVSLDTPKYVLFFGDGSYDYKYRLPGNSNYVPTYESTASINATTSFSSDDFFGWLDDAEDDNVNNIANVDVGLGRLPVRSLNEANAAVNKIIHYETASDFGNWRKDLAFVADEGDQDTHFSQMEYCTAYYDTVHCEFDEVKIYLDAYKKVFSPPSYPDVNAAISNNVNDGCLMINYIGRGGTTGWAITKVLTKDMVKSWNNFNRMPFFVNATSDFNRYDDPSDTSAGELVVLNQSGAGIASFGTSRLGFSGSNFSLQQKFNNHVIEKINGQYNRLGDIVKLAKRDYSDRYVINATLLGDPAVRLNYPVNNVALTTFNGKPVSGTIDTVHLATTIAATGEIQDPSGILLNTFNGNLHILLLRQITNYTLANDVGSYSAPFNIWGDTLYDGNATVSNGIFSFSFTIPSNVNFYYRKAKFSFYATNGNTDATGCYHDLVIGNFSINVSDLSASSSEVTLSPNPATKEATVKINTTESSTFNFYIFDAQGRKVKSLEKIMAKKFVVQLDDLAPGIYIFELVNDRHQLLSRGKIAIE